MHDRFIPAPAGNRRQMCRHFPAERRFIPAPAGNRLTPGLRRARRSRKATVHPRACGEQTRNGFGCPGPSCSGSSPRLRGTALNWPLPALEHGGSSPRLRGTDSLESSFGIMDRFIPAPAGNSARNHGSSPRLAAPGTCVPVHPRACGEQQPPGIGSPRLPCPYPVHPRACGEQPKAQSRMIRWPVHPRACGEQCRGRFIPAPAGNSCNEQSNGCDHPIPAGSSPRLRGTESAPDLEFRAFRGTSGDGSSPRLRGTAFASRISVHPRVG